eukprot:5236458-Prymnesium_polylepis.2
MGHRPSCAPVVLRYTIYDIYGGHEYGLGAGGGVELASVLRSGGTTPCRRTPDPISASSPHGTCTPVHGSRCARVHLAAATGASPLTHARPRGQTLSRLALATATA